MTNSVLLMDAIFLVGNCIGQILLEENSCDIARENGLLDHYYRLADLTIFFNGHGNAALFE